MRTKLRLFGKLSLWLCLLSVSAPAQTELRKRAEDHFEVNLNRSSRKPITLLQVTDLHLGKMDFWKQDLSTCSRIRQLVETLNPDLILVTGDLLTGEKYFGSLLAAFAVEFFDSLKKPWLYEFGNHDVEGGFGRDQIYEVFSSSRWCVLGYHQVANQRGRKYDYVVDIRRSATATPDWQIFGFDSGSEKGFKSIKEDQLAWYRAVTEASQKMFNRRIPAIAIFHIPLQQYQDIYEDAAIPKSGARKEDVSFEEDDGSPYRAFVAMKNIKATFCGHDHYNNYWGKTRDGITLAYGYISGESTNHAWPTGGKLIRLSLKGDVASIENVTP